MNQHSTAQGDSCDFDLSQYEQVGSTYKLIEVGKIPIQLRGAVSRISIITGEFGEADITKGKKQTIILYNGVQLSHYYDVQTLTITQRKKPSKEIPLGHDKPYQQNNQNVASEHKQSSSQEESQQIQKKAPKIRKQSKNKQKSRGMRRITKSSIKNRLKFLNQIQKKNENRSSKSYPNGKPEGMKTRNTISKKLSSN